MEDATKLIGEVRIKLEKLTKEDFNPWDVSDASVFLRYCCPECDYNCRRINNFSEHALQKHDRANALFSEPKLHKDLLLSSFIGLNDEIPQDFVKTELVEPKRVESTDEEAYAVYDEPKQKWTKKRKRKGGISDREVAKFNELVNQEDYLISEPNLERFYKCRKIDSVSDLSQENAKQTESEPADLIDKKEISKEPIDIEDASEDITCIDFDSILENVEGDVTFLVEESNPELTPLGKEELPIVTKVVKVQQPKLSYPLISLMEIVNNCFTCLACPEMKFSKKFQLMLHLMEEHCPSLHNIEVCQFCVEVFQSKKELLEHYENVHPYTPMTPYNCILCRNMFNKTKTSFQQIQKHYMKEHSYCLPFLPYRCSKCASRFLIEEELLEHQVKEHNFNLPELSCAKCPMTYRSKSNFLIHRYIHGEIDANQILEHCADCGYVEETKSGLLAHHQNDHPTREPPYFLCDKCDLITSTCDEMIVHSKEDHDCEYKGYKCPTCPLTCSTLSNLRTHFAMHNRKDRRNLMCIHCNEFVGTPTNYDEHVKLMHPEVSESQKLICDQCGFDTPVKEKLKQHMESVHKIYGKRPRVQCDYCDSKFPKGAKLEIHIDAIHPDCGLFKDYSCEYCGDMFIFGSSVVKHKWQCKKQSHREEYLKRIAIHGRKSGFRMKRDPDAQRPASWSSSPNIIRPTGSVQCDYCDTIFERASCINNHYELFHPDMPKILPGLKILRCESCQKEFFNSNDLEIHKSIQHGIVQKGKKICPDCKKPYIQRHKCQKEQIETNLTCQECGKVLATQRGLQKHMLNHLEKKFDCPHCDKKWPSESLMAMHIKQSHRPATCELCNSKCSSFNELKRHKVLVHEIMDGAWLCQLCPKSVFFSERTYELHLKKNH